MPPQNITDLVYIDATGYHFADYPSFLAWLVGKYQDIYGADVYVEPDSQDGQFLAILAKSFYDTAALGASVYNSFSPLSAQGTGLSRVVKINGIARNIPSYSTVALTVVGVAGTVITNGAAADVLNQKWLLPSPMTIPISGMAVVTATAQNIGAVFADIGTVTTIFTPTNGWQTVTNLTAASPGSPVESDAELRIRQSLSTGLPSLTVLEGTVAAVANVTGVTAVQGYENPTGVTDANGLPEHSICIVVAGGDSVAIAKAIQIKKTPGTQTYGPTPTTVLVYDSQGMPLFINYQVAIPASIQVTITGAAGEGWSTDYIPLIQAAVAAVINATKIGGNMQSGFLYYTTLFPAAYLNGTIQGATYSISSIVVGKNGGAQAAANVVLDFDEICVCDPTVDIVVNIA